jgi:light-regulated signal transduction histidine kinase (bacteriophytochrome)
LDVHAEGGCCLSRAAGPSPTDLASCDREPIHIPGRIQPHGLFFFLEQNSYKVLQASANCEAMFGGPIENILNKPLDLVLGRDLKGPIESTLIDPGFPRYIDRISLQSPAGTASYHVIAHRKDGGIIVELESIPEGEHELLDPSSPMEEFLASRPANANTVQLANAAAQVIRRVTAFDRVLVYRFDENWNGTVIAEDRNETLPPYLGLSFPASDIPKQARELYRLNRIRLISDANYSPVSLIPELNPLTGRPLDLSFSTLRSVSPVHVEYMRNMGTMASMSFSLLRDGQLWGLISCHNSTPRHTSFQRRAACDILCQILSLELASYERNQEDRYLIFLQSVQARLLLHMTEQPRFIGGLLQHTDDLLALTASEGAAIVFEDECHLIGKTPAEPQVREITEWLKGRGSEVLHTDCLPEQFPEVEHCSDVASGLLAVSMSKLERSYVLWFRPELVKTIVWGGDPAKAVSTEERISPRKSFEAWKQVVRHRSLPWRSSEVSAATELRNSMVGIVLRRAEEIAQLNAELERSNRELEAFSYSVSHDLRAPLRHIAGYADLLRETSGESLNDKAMRYLDTINESAEFAGTLVDNLLHFSRVGRVRLEMMPVNFDRVVRDISRELQREAEGREIRWTISPLPTVEGDLVMLQVVWRNLLGNAVKYTRNRAVAEIQVGCENKDHEFIFYVRDNGTGFDMKYADKLFGVFQRLHRMEEYEGTGIGLANVRRIISRHGGRTWAFGEVDKGATFYFSLLQKGIPETA